MPLDATGDEVRYNGAIGTDLPNDVALSPDGAYIYVAGNDGNLRIYSADTGELLRTIDVGTSLGAIDLSPDGSFAVVVELVPLEENANEYGDPIYTVAVKVDLVTGVVTTFEFVTNSDNYVFKDLAVLANGDVLLTPSPAPAYSSVPTYLQSSTSIQEPTPQ